MWFYALYKLQMLFIIILNIVFCAAGAKKIGGHVNLRFKYLKYQ